MLPINFHASQAHKVNMSHIESRPSKRSKTEYDFFVDCEEIQGPRLTNFVDALKDQALSITVHSEEGGGERYISHIISPALNKPLDQIIHNIRSQSECTKKSPFLMLSILSQTDKTIFQTACQDFIPVCWY